MRHILKILCILLFRQSCGEKENSVQIVYYGIEAILYDNLDARKEYQGTRITDLISVIDLYA